MVLINIIFKNITMNIKKLFFLTQSFLYDIHNMKFMILNNELRYIILI